MHCPKIRVPNQSSGPGASPDRILAALRRSIAADTCAAAAAEVGDGISAESLATRLKAKAGVASPALRVGRSSCAGADPSLPGEDDENAPDTSPARRAAACASRMRWTRHRKPCCVPMTDPGRITRSHPMAVRAVKPCDRIMYTAMSVPVRPSPALQCTVTAPLAASTMARNAATRGPGGSVQSAKTRAWCLIPASSKARASYASSLRAAPRPTHSRLERSRRSARARSCATRARGRRRTWRRPGLVGR